MASSIIDDKYKAIEEKSPKVSEEHTDKKEGQKMYPEMHTMEITIKILNLVRPHLSDDDLETLQSLLVDLDTEARRDMVAYIRRNRERYEP